MAEAYEQHDTPPRPRRRGADDAAPLTSAEVMQHLGISRATFWKYMREYPRHFRTFRSGKWRVMDRADLEAWKTFRKSLDRV